MTRPDPYYVEERIELKARYARVTIGSRSIDVVICRLVPDWVSGRENTDYNNAISGRHDLRMFLDGLYEAGRQAGREEVTQ